MRETAPASLSDSTLDKLASLVASRVLAKLREDAREVDADLDQLLGWEGVGLELMRLRPGSKKPVRQTIWKMVLAGKLPEPSHRPNSRVARWRRGDVIEAVLAWR
jgi:hypothetical protein